MDETGLSNGFYNFEFDWEKNGAETDVVNQALLDQLGLKLTPGTEKDRNIGAGKSEVTFIIRLKQQDNMNIRSKRAFTLVEMLVVIGVIGILASLLFVAISRAKQSAMRTQCLSQTKTTGARIANVRAGQPRFYAMAQLGKPVSGLVVYPSRQKTSRTCQSPEGFMPGVALAIYQVGKDLLVPYGSHEYALFC